MCPSISTQSPVSERKRFDLDAPAPLPGDVYWVRPYAGTEEGMPSNGAAPGGFWRTFELPDTEEAGGAGAAWMSLALVDGRPAIAYSTHYHESGAEDLRVKYMRASDSLGESLGQAAVYRWGDSITPSST